MIVLKLLPWLVLFSVMSCLFLVGALWFLRSQLQDDSIPVLEQFAQASDKVMFIFPHPDDEITCAGTLKQLDEQGIETILLTLTKGEAGPTSGLIDESSPSKKAQLADLRQQELQSSAKLLGIDHLEILDFPDGGIQDIPSETIRAILYDKIQVYQPSILVTYDDQIGLYGHPDHIEVARHLKDLFLEFHSQQNFSPSQLYQVTLPRPMIEIALKISDTFRKNYHNSQDGLPPPDLAIKIAQWGYDKRQVFESHRSQKDSLSDLQPYYDKFPPFVYFRVFDKEYFTQVKPETP